MRFPLLAKELAKRTKAIMVRIKMHNVDDFALLCQIDRDTMYSILNGAHNMTDSSMIKICHYTNTSMDVFTKGCYELVDEKYDMKRPL
jgi:hypothetical protein